jgi:lipoyl(octanoyl) transferase
MDLVVKDLGLVEYQKFLEIQKQLTLNDKNILLFANHYPIYTRGKNENSFEFALKVDRGGSITYFDEGVLMVYFIFNIYSPPIFFKNVKKVFNSLFENYPIVYDKKKAGYYIENRKIVSLGFSYKNNRSNHGIAINIDPNLDNFNKINPCNLDGIKATSFQKEGIKIDEKSLKDRITKLVKEYF